MPPSDSFEQKKVDPRIYLGILVFRWKLIVICFLYCLLGGVAYLQFASKEYDTLAGIMIYRDPSTQIESQNYRLGWSQTHIALLQSDAFQNMIVEALTPVWLKRLGGDVKKMVPDLVIKQARGTERGAINNISFELSIRSSHPAYARAFLNEAFRQFQIQRETIKGESYGSASRLLEDELARLRDQIRAAEDDVIEYQLSLIHISEPTRPY